MTFLLCILVLAERRAQLVRSRSRQSLLSPAAEKGVMAVARQIQYERDFGEPVTPVNNNNRNNAKKHAAINGTIPDQNGSKIVGRYGSGEDDSRTHRKGGGGGNGRTEAEEILERLRAM